MGRIKAKLIGGAIALAATMLSLGAGTAFAWTYSLSGSGACQDNGSFKITWTVNNSGESKAFHVTASNRSVIAVGTNVASHSNQSFSEYVSGTTLTTYTLQISGNWPGGDNTIVTKSASVTLSHACQQPRHDCDNNYIRDEHDECVPPQKDCDNDYDHSPASDCEGSITVVKHLVPTSDTGVFNLMVGNTAVATNVGNNGQGTANHLTAGSYTVSESAGTNTSLANYTSSVSCTNDATGTTSVSVSLSAGQNITCTFTNTATGKGGGPVTDCDNDTDNSPSSECTTTTPQVLGSSTTTGSGAAQVAVVPTGSVNGGEGAASRVTSGTSMVGLVGALISVGSGLALLNRKQN